MTVLPRVSDVGNVLLPMGLDQGCPDTLSEPQILKAAPGSGRQQLPERLLPVCLQIDIHNPEVRLSDLKPGETLLTPEKVAFDNNQLNTFRDLPQKIIFEMIVRYVLHEYLVSQRISFRKSLPAYIIDLTH